VAVEGENMKTFTIVFLAAFFIPSLATSQDCIDYGEYLHCVGAVDTPGAADGVAVAATYAYLADGDSGLQVVDISEPESPVIVGEVDTPGYAADVAIAGNYAFVADRGHGLQVIEISVPESPVIVGAESTPGDAMSVAVAGNYAYVADRGSGLQVIDILVAESPALLGGVGTPDEAFGVVVAGDYAYVADGYSGLQVTWRQCEEALEVAIDVQPGSDTNPINCRAFNAVVPVAVLTTEFFDATSVEMAKYTLDLYSRLESETDLSTGYLDVGMLNFATSTSRLEEFRRISAFLVPGSGAGSCFVEGPDCE